MECAWKEVRTQDNLQKVCDRYGAWFLEFADYSLTMIMHEVCGWGAAKRLPDLFDGMDARLNEEMRSSMADDGELWDTTQTTYYGLRRDIRDRTGWNPETTAAQYPVRDFYKPIIGDDAETNRHAFRKNFIEAMEIKMGVYWYMVLRYLAEEHRFGAVRLERVYRRIRIEYREYAELFLKSSAAAEKNMHRITERLKKAAAKLGIQYDYGNGSVPTRKNAKDDADDSESEASRMMRSENGMMWPEMPFVHSQRGIGCNSGVQRILDAISGKDNKPLAERKSKEIGGV